MAQLVSLPLVKVGKRGTGFYLKIQAKSTNVSNIGDFGTTSKSSSLTYYIQMDELNPKINEMIGQMVTIDLDQYKVKEEEFVPDGTDEIIVCKWCYLKPVPVNAE